MIVNFAERAHNHNWELDPVTRSLLDTDFYKLLMLQFIWKHYPKTRVQFTLFNRSSTGPIDTFAHEELTKAVTFFRKAVELDPGYAKVNSELGWALRRLNQNKEAEYHLRKAIELDETRFYGAGAICGIGACGPRAGG